MLAYCAYIDDDPASGQNNPIIKEFIGIEKIVYSTAATLVSFIKTGKKGSLVNIEQMTINIVIFNNGENDIENNLAKIPDHISIL